MLISSSGGEISIVDGDNSVFLTLDSSVIDRLCTLSGLKAKDVVADLIGSETVIFEVAPQRFESRMNYVSLLMSQGGENRVSVLTANNKVLEDSTLIADMDNLSGGFDSALLEQVKGVEKTYQYELSSILYGANSWEDAKSFFSEWIKVIIR